MTRDTTLRCVVVVLKVCLADIGKAAFVFCSRRMGILGETAIRVLADTVFDARALYVFVSSTSRQ